MNHCYYCRVCGSYSISGECPNCGRALTNEESGETQKDK
jgi:hypothetical protein